MPSWHGVKRVAAEWLWVCCSMGAFCGALALLVWLAEHA